MPHKTSNWIETYQDDLDNFYAHDIEEGLTFVREKIGQNKYGLVVIIEEENSEYWKWEDALSPDQPCGFQIFDEISLKDWNRFVKDYVRNRNRGEQIFEKWLFEKVYSPLGKISAEQSWFLESLPYPDAPQEVLDDFNRAYKIFKDI